MENAWESRDGVRADVAEFVLERILELLRADIVALGEFQSRRWHLNSKSMSRSRNRRKRTHLHRGSVEVFKSSDTDVSKDHFLRSRYSHKANSLLWSSDVERFSYQQMGSGVSA